MSNEQEHRISYKAGITRTPSDFLCQDGELAECINLTTDNEELKPIVPPAEYVTNTTTSGGVPTILYVHKYNESERYIGYNSSNQLVWCTKGGTTFVSVASLNTPYDSSVKISSIGKTLVISSNNFPIRTFIWQSNGYSTAISSLPTIKLGADLQRKGVMTHTGQMGDIFGETKFDTNILEKDKSEYNDLVTGLYLKNVADIAHKKCFCKPFFVCAALELFDGTYTMMSQPILMPVVLSNNLYGSIWLTPSGQGEYTYTRAMKVYTGYAELAIRQETDYSMYSDIVKDVVIFVTDGINFYDTGGDQSIQFVPDNGVLINGIEDHQVKTTTNPVRPSSGNFECNFYIINKRASNEINDDIKGASIFYRICSLGVNPKELYPVTGYINSNTLDNLTTQKRLDATDYYSNNELYSNLLFSYNSRLNIAGVKRSIFPGFSFFMPYGTETEGYTIKVEIKTDTGNKVAVLENATISDKAGFWFFYPDPRAKKVVISKNETVTFAHKLEEHKGLNGACCFLKFPLSNSETPSSDDTTITVTDQSPELLPNYIITSEVNNPWIFPKEGYNKVGTGKILAISTATMALSQDQFGKTPLIVFSESGVWGMRVDNTGLYEGIDPFTRDIAINPHNIIQTDGAVYFVSKRGLMIAIATNTNDRGVRCVSEQVKGRVFDYTSKLTGIATGNDWESIISTCQDAMTFQQYASDSKCVIAYDYTENRLILSRTDKSYSYIYNITDGSIAKVILPETIKNVVNNYPDYLMQSSSKIYSLYNKKLEEEDSTIKNAFLLTRPMKLSGPVSKASLRQLKNVGMWDEANGSSVKTKLYLSDDLYNWYEDGSRFGAAAKYYRIALFIKMLPSERLSGTIITTQDRRTNNLR